MVEEYKIHLEEDEKHLKAWSEDRPDIETRPSTRVEAWLEVVPNLDAGVYQAPYPKH